MRKASPGSRSAGPPHLPPQLVPLLLPERRQVLLEGAGQRRRTARGPSPPRGRGGPLPRTAAGGSTGRRPLRRAPGDRSGPPPQRRKAVLQEIPPERLLPPGGDDGVQVVRHLLAPEERPPAAGQAAKEQQPFDGMPPGATRRPRRHPHPEQNAWRQGRRKRRERNGEGEASRPRRASHCVDGHLLEPEQRGSSGDPGRTALLETPDALLGGGSWPRSDSAFRKSSGKGYTSCDARRDRDRGFPRSGRPAARKRKATCRRSPRCTRSTCCGGGRPPRTGGRSPTTSAGDIARKRELPPSPGTPGSPGSANAPATRSAIVFPGSPFQTTWRTWS